MEKKERRGKLVELQKVVMASACLCGHHCRWNGKGVYNRRLKKMSGDGVLVMPICPEMLGGLNCPRPPVIRVGERIFVANHAGGGKRAVGPERTAEFRLGARRALRIAKRMGAKTAYLLSHSPSCCPQRGITGQLFKAKGIKTVAM